MSKNADLSFLLLEHILADQLPDLPTLEASSEQEYQFYIYTVTAHIGRSNGTSTPSRGIYWARMAILHLDC